MKGDFGMAARKQTATVDLKLRMKEPLRASLAKAAKKRGVSLNFEAVERLGRSIHHEGLFPQALELAFGKRLAGMLLVIGRAMDEAGTLAAFSEADVSEGARARINWMDSSYAFDQAVQAVTVVLEDLRPAGDRAPKRRPTSGSKDVELDAVLAASKLHLGSGLAKTLLGALRGESLTAELKEWAGPVRKMLGSVGDRINQTSQPVGARKPRGQS